MAISRTEAGEEINPMTAGVPIKQSDFIVARYDEMGGKIREGGVAGGSTISSKIASKLEKAMARSGEKVTFTYGINPTKSIKTKAKTKRTKANPLPEKPVLPKPDYLDLNISESKEEPVESNETPTIPKITKVVEMIFNFGKIKALVDAVVINETGVALIFESSNTMTFIPEAGTELNLSVEGQTLNVMYLGITFQWYNSNQQVMLFIKTNEE